MNSDVVKHISISVSQLEDVVGRMILGGGSSSSIVDVLYRALEVGHATLMYQGELTGKELEMVDSILAFVNRSVAVTDVNSVDSNIAAIEEVVSRIEVLYKSKQLLLGNETDEKIKCA